MNSWKLNSMSNYYLRKCISEFFNIHIADVYKKVKNIDENHIITTDDVKKYKLTLKEIV